MSFCCLGRLEGSIVVQKVREGKDDFGYNARTDEYQHLKKAGVIDPTKVTRIALENAASIASMLLTTEAVVVDKPEEKKEGAALPLKTGQFFVDVLLEWFAVQPGRAIRTL